jgi:hypothetical protein
MPPSGPDVLPARASIEAKLERLESKPMLDPHGIEVDVRRPELVRRRLADPLRYAQRVEALVTGMSIETLLPRAAQGGYVGRFLAVWQPDEQRHAVALGRLLDRLDLAPDPVPVGQAVPFHNRVVGALGMRCRHAHETVELAYHVIGAMNEKLAFTAYERMAGVLVASGERDLAESLMRPLRRDESAHLGYYRTVARDLRDRLDRWQLAAARTLIVRTYAPVGAGAASDKPAFGRTVRALSERPGADDLPGAVQRIAESLLSRDGRTLPPFVQRSVDACVDTLAAEAPAHGPVSVRSPVRIESGCRVCG